MKKSWKPFEGHHRNRQAVIMLTTLEEKGKIKNKNQRYKATGVHQSIEQRMHCPKNRQLVDNVLLDSVLEHL